MVIKAILDKVLTMGTVVNYKNILATLEDNVQLNMSLDEIISIASGYRKSMENFQQFYVEGEELYIDEIYYYYVDPEERLRLSNILRTELELPEITIDEISTSANEPYYDTNAYSTDSSYSDTTYDSSTYGQSDVYTPNYSRITMKKRPMNPLIERLINGKQLISGLFFLFGNNTIKILFSCIRKS
jgi:hypothetical protein